MSEEIKKDPSKEEMEEAIRKAFKDNEEGLKAIESIMNNMVKLREMDKTNPSSSAFRLWIMFLVFLLGGLDNVKENESNNKDRESDLMEESTQCS